MTTYITGRMMKLDEPNSNNRIYLSNTMQNAIDKVSTKISHQNLFSEILPQVQTNSTVNLDLVGGIVTNLFIEDEYVCAKIKLIPTSTTTSNMELLLNPDFKYMLSFKAYGNVSMIGDVNYVETVDFISVDVLPYDGSNPDRIVKFIEE